MPQLYPYLIVENGSFFVFLVKKVPGRGPEQRESGKTVLYLLIIIIILISYIIITLVIKIRTITAKIRNRTPGRFVVVCCKIHEAEGPEFHPF
jgi:hypothetical protein